MAPGRSSARPANLETFVKQTRGITADLQREIKKLTVSYQDFQSSGSVGRITSGTVEGSLPALVGRQQHVTTFVDLVRAAFERADSGTLRNGVVSVGDTELQATYELIARQNGLDPAVFDKVQAALPVSPVKVGAIPRSSGFVDDPVCTATGHFLEDETDFVVPERLAVLAWPRRYSSRLLVPGPFGRGWFTWASTRLVRDDGGDAAYRGPDGSHLEFAAHPEGGFARLAGVGAEVREGDGEGEGLVLVWDADSTFALQRWRFAADGRLLTVSAALLGTTTFEYDGDRLVRLVHDGGRALDLRWHGERIVEAALSDGRTVRYRYDDDGDLAAVERATGDHRYESDEQGRIVSVHDADGVRLCHNTYDGEGRVLRQVSPLGRETVFEYLPGRRTRVSDTTGGPAALYEHDLLGRVTGLINGDGHRFERHFDERGRVVGQQHLDRSGWQRRPTDDPLVEELVDEAGDGERWVYDEAGRLVEHTDADRTVTFVYEGDSVLPAVIRTGDAVTTFEWRDGRPAAVTDADGVRVDVAYDADGCAVQVIDALGATTTISRHPTGEAASIGHPDGTAHHLDRDDAGRLVGVRDPAGAEIRFTYSAAGRLLAVTDPEGGRTAFGYGSSGALESVTDPLGRRGELRWDALGNLVGVVEANGGKWEFDFTAMGQPSLVHAPDGATWSLARDAEGRITEVIDPLGGVSTPAPPAAAPDGAVTSTPAGRVATMTDRSGTTTCTYDAAGRLTAVTGPDGGVRRYELDERDRVVTEISPAGRRTGYRYDDAGRLAEVDQAGVRRRFAYDRCGRVVAVTDGLGAVTRYRYDVAGQLVAATDPRGATVEFRYDDLGELVETIDPFGAAVRITRDICGRPVEQHDPLGRITAWSYDARGELLAVTQPDGERLPLEPPPAPEGEPLAVDPRFGPVEVTRDADGLLTGLVAAGVRRSWAYDDGGRLVAYEEATATGRQRTTLRRDAAGRVIEARRGDQVTTYEYDAAGQLIAERGPGGDRTFTYDDAGRLVAEAGPDGTRRLAYDAAGQLTAAVADDGATTFAYDAAGRRVAESGGADRTYRWSRRGDLREVVHDGRVTRVESRGTELAAVDELTLDWDRGGAVSRPRRIGTERVLAVDGHVLATVAEDPDAPVHWSSADWRGSVSPRDAWGRPAAPGVTSPVVGLGFLGEVEVAGLVWLRHRVLDPATGQFLSPDPLGGVAGTPVATFGYHYAGNDPIGFVDPLGLKPLSIEEYEKIRSMATGVQWQNVATAAIVIAGAAAAPFTGGATLVAIGVGLGAAGAAVPHVYKGIRTGEWEPGVMAKDMIFGGAFGALGGLGGAVTKALGPKIGTYGANILFGMGTGGGGAAAQELYDTTKLPGSARNKFDWANVAANTAVGGAGGAVSTKVDDILQGRRPAPGGDEMDPGGGGGRSGGGSGDGGAPPPPQAPVEPPPPVPPLEGPPPPPRPDPNPVFSHAPQPQSPPPGGPQGDPNPVFSHAPERQSPPPGGPQGDPNPQFSHPPERQTGPSRPQGDPNPVFSG